MPEDFLRRPRLLALISGRSCLHYHPPHLKPTFAVLAMLTVTNGLLFDLDMGHDPGRTGREPQRHDILYLQKAFTNRDFGAGTAASVILMLIMVADYGG